VRVGHGRVAGHGPRRGDQGACRRSAPLRAADTAFGLDVLRAWCRADPRGNLVLSPSSLAAGWAWRISARSAAPHGHRPGAASAAAGGDALEAACRRLGGPAPLDSPGVTLAASDQVWADPTLDTRRGYLNAVATSYGAGVAQVPMLSHPDQAAQEINHAIAVATKGQIPQLLSSGSLYNIGWC